MECLSKLGVILPGMVGIHKTPKMGGVVSAEIVMELDGNSNVLDRYTYGIACIKNDNHGFYLWNTRASSIIGSNNLRVYGMDFLDNGEYLDLEYPFQDKDTVYYTTIDLKTDDNCITAKADSVSKESLNKNSTIRE